MRTLILTIGHWQDRPSGSARIAFDEAVELRRRGEEVWILARGESSYPEYEVSEGINLLRYCEPTVRSWNPARAFVHQLAVTRVLKRYLPAVDAVHGHIPLATLAALKLYGDAVHSCYTVHSPASMEMAIEWKSSSFSRRITAPVGLLFINRIEAECLNRSQIITALSQYTKTCIRRIHGDALSERVLLAPGWVDTSRFVPIENRDHAKAQLGWPINVPVLFTLRRLSSRMGLNRLLDAISHLLSEGMTFHLMIGGDGPMRKMLENQTDGLGIGRSVTFLGRVDDSLLPLAYAACDAFVLPTTELECFGIIALEALSAGRPVLATPVGAIPEMIRTFEPTWLARSARVDDIITLLRTYLMGGLPTHQPAILHDQVHRNYSSEVLIGKFVDLTVGNNGSYHGVEQLSLS
jgi:glycosyltransferase involved in cell wall biosynthesis